MGVTSRVSVGTCWASALLREFMVTVMGSVGLPKWSRMAYRKAAVVPDSHARWRRNGCTRRSRDAGPWTSRRQNALAAPTWPREDNLEADHASARRGELGEREICAVMTGSPCRLPLARRLRTGLHSWRNQTDISPEIRRPRRDARGLFGLGGILRDGPALVSLNGFVEPARLSVRKYEVWLWKFSIAAPAVDGPRRYAVAASQVGLAPVLLWVWIPFGRHVLLPSLTVGRWQTWREVEEART